MKLKKDNKNPYIKVFTKLLESLFTSLWVGPMAFLLLGIPVLLAVNEIILGNKSFDFDKVFPGGAIISIIISTVYLYSKEY